MAAHRRCLLLFFEIFLLVSIILLSSAAVVTTALLKLDFNGDCPLFPTIEDVDYFNIYPSNDSNCGYIMGANTVTCIVSILFLIFVLAEQIMKKQITVGMPYIKIAVFIVLFVLVVGSAIVVTLGFKALCDGLATLVDEKYHNYQTCKEWQGDKYWKAIFEYDGSNFYSFLLTSQVATWLSSGLLLLLPCLSCIGLVCCKDQRNSADDNIALVY